MIQPRFSFLDLFGRTQRYCVPFEGFFRQFHLWCRKAPSTRIETSLRRLIGDAMMLCLCPPFLFWFEEMVNRTRQVATVHLAPKLNGLSPFSSNGYSYSVGQRARVCATTDRMCSIVIPWHSKYSSQLDRNCSNSVSVNNASICGLGSWSNVR